MIPSAMSDFLILCHAPEQLSIGFSLSDSGAGDFVFLSPFKVVGIRPSGYAQLSTAES